MKKTKLLKIFIAIVLLISIDGMAIAATIGVVNVDTVRVRKKATTESGIVQLVSIGDKITIISEEENWYKVKVDGKEGYIRKDLLTVEGKNISTEKTEPNNSSSQTEGQETNNEQKLNGETPNENIIEKPNETINTLEEKNDKTISIMKIEEGVSIGEKIQLKEDIKLKILPLVNSSNIVKIEANEEVIILEVMNKWCRVETTEGICGWVRINR